MVIVCSSRKDASENERVGTGCNPCTHILRTQLLLHGVSADKEAGIATCVRLRVVYRPGFKRWLFGYSVPLAAFLPFVDSLDDGR